MKRDNNLEVFFDLLKIGLFPELEISGIRNQFIMGENGHAVHGTSIAWDRVCQLAEEQSVVGLITDDIANSNVEIPQSVKLQLVGGTLQIEKQNQVINAFVAKLIDRLRDESVYTILVKGQV